MDENSPAQDSWRLSFRDPSVARAVEIRFSILRSKNGFHRSAEVWGIYFEKNGTQTSSKTVIKEAHDLSKFSTLEDGFQIANCKYSSNRSQGSIQSKGQSIEWDLQYKPRQNASFDFIPTSVKKISLLKNHRITPQADLLFSGTMKINGKSVEFNQAPGLQSQQSGERNSHSWISGHSNSFKTEQGTEVPFIFEAVSLKNYFIGNIPSPKVSSFYFVYDGKTYYFNSIRDVVHLKSKNSISEWVFRAEKGDLIFQGTIHFELKDFAGLSFEDTNGSMIYLSESKFSDLKIQIYDQGKLKLALVSDQTTSIEIVSRKKNPYVQILN